MRNFTTEELKFLVDNGYLMPAEEKYYKKGYPTKNKKQQHPVGYPILIDKEKFIEKNYNFPDIGLKLYNFKFVEHGNCFKDFYLVPNGLQDMINFNKNPELHTLLQKWIGLSEIFILENTTGEKEQQLEIDLLKLFREIYYLYIINRQLDLSPIHSLYFNLAEQGQYYREMLYKNFPKAFEDINHSNMPLLNSIIETSDDLIQFETSIIQNSQRRGYNSYCSIRIGMLQIWNTLLNYKSLKSSYKIESPFFHKFKEHLFSLKYNRISPDVTINVLEWLFLYDFSLIKDIYIKILQNSNKKPLNLFIEEKLKLHNCLPEVSKHLVRSQKTIIIYQELFSFDFGYIKTHVNNHVYAGECLVAIVEKAFREHEKNCSRVSWQHFDTENVVEFLIETLDQAMLPDLISTLISYINTALSPEFLDEPTIKLLCKHPSNAFSRKLYENDKKVMEKYLNLKDKIVLKNKLEKKLVPKKSTEKVKKI